MELTMGKMELLIMPNYRNNWNPSNQNILKILNCLIIFPLLQILMRIWGLLILLKHKLMWMPLFKINLQIIRLFKDNKTKLNSNNKIINKINNKLIFPKIKMKTFSTLKFIKIIKIILNLITQFLLFFL